MFEQFKKIIIKGGCFEKETELELFKNEEISVLYGRNGSGKTTISNCIKEVVKPKEARNPDFSVSANIEIPEDRADSVFIFNEDFIREQVRVEKDGINVIVMLGEQVELDNQINLKKTELQIIENELNCLLDEKRKYEDAKNMISPQYCFNQIKKALHEDNGWAEIDSKIKENRTKSKVTEDLINLLLNLVEPKESIEELDQQLKENLKLYRESKDSQELNWSSTPNSLPKNLDDLTVLLKKPIENPLLSEREQRLFSVFSSHPQYRQATKDIIDSESDMCPLCFQNISHEHKSDLKNILQHFLNKEADNYRQLLDEAIVQYENLDTDFPKFPGDFNSGIIERAKDAMIALNEVLSKCRSRINSRQEKIYETIQEPFSKKDTDDYKKAIEDWASILEMLTSCVIKFNDSVNARKKLKTLLHTQNNLLARKKHSALLLNYNRAHKKAQSNAKNIQIKSNEFNAKDNEIQLLKAQKERTDIALDYINQELHYVFFSSRKVTLEAGDGCYKLKINGKGVRPHKLSVGERNVLGLCYFFAKLFGGKTDKRKYNSEYLLIIDDPVSSFDYGNRVGVMSLLRYQFNNIINGNSNSRILVMSHDLHSIFDLMKIRNDITPKENKFFRELVNSQIQNINRKNEYLKLIESIFNYASNSETCVEDDIFETSIGNTMRRVLEAFSTFCYNKGFNSMFKDKEILELVPEGKREYYENFMFRLTLNTESHMEEYLSSLNDVVSRYSREEKTQIAKSLLLFLLYVNKPHLTAYLKEKVTEIERWKSEEELWIKNLNNQSLS